MSKLNHLQQQLDKWKSHNELHARPSDNILYDLIKELLNLLDEPDQSQPEAPAPPPAPPITAADESGPGQNNPPAPDIP